ncbi:Hypp549 [Branchiostoma lanceolatum]|uniref:Hypp549 protein n=1 Tax=Branchiostoma lanceolatum TaxID=7740 RepID=A0A8J9YR24_BRALA|nr:Hypp549 [Branchiostoma lanceolatum]
MMRPPPPLPLTINGKELENVAVAQTPLMVVFPRRMKTFVGRKDVFRKIDACLEQNQTCLIKGLGGVGKTSLAIEYGHRRAGSYPGGVFWVRLAESQAQ